MNYIRTVIFTGSCILLLGACSNVTFTPRSRTNILEQRPSIFIYSGIVDFREEFGCWPSSKEDMLVKGGKYAQAFDGFRYNYTRFKIKDSNSMVFYFSDHVKDAQTYQNTGEVEINKYYGRVKFYKHEGKFIWKLKMK